MTIGSSSPQRRFRVSYTFHDEFIRANPESRTERSSRGRERNRVVGTLSRDSLTADRAFRRCGFRVPGVGGPPGIGRESTFGYGDLAKLFLLRSPRIRKIREADKCPSRVRGNA